MRNMYLHRITDKRFTVRFCTAAKFNGFKTVGKFKKFLEQNERVKLPAAHTIKSSKLLEELNEYLDSKVIFYLVIAYCPEDLHKQKFSAFVKKIDNAAYISPEEMYRRIYNLSLKKLNDLKERV